MDNENQAFAISEAIDELINSINNLLEIEDEQFNVVKDLLKENIRHNFTGQEMEQQARLSAQAYRDQGFTLSETISSIQEIKEQTVKLFEAFKEQTSNENKHDFLDFMAQQISNYYDSVIPIYEAEHPTVRFFRALETAKLPSYAHSTDQGADVYSPVDITIPPHSVSTLVPTGLRAVIPQGWALAIRARSGMSKKTGLRVSNAVGTIDTGYLGDIGILFDNISDTPVEIKAGDRIAQFILEKCYQMEMEEIDDISIYETDRGEGGFGSTDK